MNEAELENIGFRFLGQDVKISRLASFYNPDKISIGSFTRLDDFCVISAGEGGIEIGRNVHIAVYTSLIGKEKITVSDFANLSSRVSIYSSDDDYSGKHMTNPTVSSKYTKVYSASVSIGEHAIIGSGSIILPGVTIGQGAGIGALSLVTKDCDPFKIYAGVPAKYLKERDRNLVRLAENMLYEESRDEDHFRKL